MLTSRLSSKGRELRLLSVAFFVSFNTTSAQVSTSSRTKKIINWRFFINRVQFHITLKGERCGDLTVLSHQVSLPYLFNTVVNAYLLNLIQSTMEVMWRWECTLERRDLQSRTCQFRLAPQRCRRLQTKREKTQGTLCFFNSLNPPARSTLKRGSAAFISWFKCDCMRAIQFRVTAGSSRFVLF